MALEAVRGERAPEALITPVVVGEWDEWVIPFVKESDMESGVRPLGNLVTLYGLLRDDAERCFLRELDDCLCCSFFSKAFWAAVNAQMLKLKTC